MCNMLFSLLKWSQLIMFDRLILTGYSSEDVNTCLSLGGFLMSSASAMSSALIVGWSRSQFSSEEQWKSSRFHHIELSTILFLVKPCEGKSVGFIFPGAMSPISFACQLTNLIHTYIHTYVYWPLPQRGFSVPITKEKIKIKTYTNNLKLQLQIIRISFLPLKFV